MRLIKSVRLDVQAAYMGEINNKHRFRGGGGGGSLKDKNHFGEPGKTVKDLKTKDTKKVELSHLTEDRTVTET